MKKELVTGLTLVALCFTSFTSLWAKEDLSDQAKIQVLREKKIVQGNEKGDLGLDKPISRGELAKILVVSLDLKGQAQQLKHTPASYKDVDKAHWAHGYIKALSTLNSSRKVPLLTGYEDGTFQPARFTSKVEASKILSLMGTPETSQATVDKITWPEGWMKVTKALGLSFGEKNPNLEATRQEVFINLYDVCFGNRVNTKDLKDLLPVEDQKPPVKPEEDQSLKGLVQKMNQDRAYQTTYRQEMLALLNQERLKKGARPLDLKEDLARGSRERAGELALYGSTRVKGKKHVRLDGANFRTAFHYLVLESPRYQLGENLLMTKMPYSYLKNPTTMIHNPKAQASYDFKAWMNSPSHKDNMLYSAYSHVWIEINLGSSYRDDQSQDAGILVGVMTLYKDAI